MKELISIIVPVYNVEKYLSKCIESLLYQSYENLEILLIDDGSTDNSLQICKEYAQKDTRIVFIQKQNEGVLKTRNLGIELAKGAYIGFVDADDWIEQEMFEKLYDLIQTTSSDISICNKYIYDDITKNKFKEFGGLKHGEYIKEAVLEQYFSIHPSNAMSRNLYDKLFKADLIRKNYKKVDTRLHYFEDIVLTFFCVLDTTQICKLEEAYYYYRQRQDSACHRIDTTYTEQVGIFYNNILQEVSHYSKELKKQLDQYIVDRTFWGINRMMGLELEKEILYYIPPFEMISKYPQIILYGAGDVGRSYYKMLEQSYPSKVVLWVDRQYKVLQEKGWNVSSVEQIKEASYDMILLAIRFEDNAMRIKKDLIEMGIPEDKIYWEAPETLI